MNPISHDSLLNPLHWRYATKAFDPSRKIPAEDWAALEQSLILTPTSYGFQPFRFVVITDQATKEKLVPHSWNQKQPADCSHYLVFAAKETVSREDVDHYLARIAEVRGIAVESLDFFRKMLTGDLIEGPRSRIQQEWATRQAYISLGTFLTATAMLGIDTCPMEGIDPVKYDEILGLSQSGYRTVVAAAAGYRAAGDKYASMAKVRFPAEELMIRI